MDFFKNAIDLLKTLFQALSGLITISRFTIAPVFRKSSDKACSIPKVFVPP